MRQSGYLTDLKQNNETNASRSFGTNESSKRFQSVSDWTSDHISKVGINEILEIGPTCIPFDDFASPNGKVQIVLTHY